MRVSQRPDVRRRQGGVLTRKKYGAQNGPVFPREKRTFLVAARPLSGGTEVLKSFFPLTSQGFL